MTVITRFAPSPTGSLHIGGARTALFNWLWARHNGGKFLLRIEDTDTIRNLTGVEDQIETSLKWLGLDWDDGYVHRQSENAYQHVCVASELQRLGAAYVDFDVEAEKETGKPYRGKDRDVVFDYSNEADFSWMEREHVIRMKVPEGKLTIQDHVQGEVTVDCSEIEDFVIVRSNGSPTFLLAGAVDDIEMGVNWVIRGDDHLNNAFKQKLIYDALGADLPNYAHIPLIHNAAGKKYSKRDGAAGVDEFARDYEPDALFNYLLRLGWGHGNDEIISREQAVEWFDIANVKRNPARLDETKLKSVNSHYVRTMAPETFGQNLGLDPKHYWLVPEVQKRIQTVPEAIPYLRFLTERPVALYEQNSIDVIPYLERTNWTAQDLKDETMNFCEARDLKMKDVAASIRWSLCGAPHSLSVFDMMAALGKDETIHRLLGNRATIDA